MGSGERAAPAAFARYRPARPPGSCDEATDAFACATTWRVAHLPSRRLRQWASRGRFPTAVPFKLRGADLFPRPDLHRLEHSVLDWTRQCATCMNYEFIIHEDICCGLTDLAEQQQQDRDGACGGSVRGGYRRLRILRQRRRPRRSIPRLCMCACRTTGGRAGNARSLWRCCKRMWWCGTRHGQDGHNLTQVAAS
jgi:hypothetical protein